MVSEGIFRVLLFRKYFLGFSVIGKVYFGSSEIPNSTYPCLWVCQVHGKIDVRKYKANNVAIVRIAFVVLLFF